MANAVIIDDEPRNNRILRKMLEDFCPQVKVIGEAENAELGVQVIRELNPELVFLDIEMPYGNAFDLLDRLKPVRFEVIFVTAFNDYSLKAFRYSALDYLLKPVNIEELQGAVKRAVEKVRSKHLQSQIEVLLQNMNKPDPSTQKLALPSREGLVFIVIGDIIRCEANGGYTYFHMQNNERIISAKNIKEYEDLLPEKLFFRVHHSHLINLNCIKKYHRGRGGFVEMSDGAHIEVATRRKDEFLARFNL